MRATAVDCRQALEVGYRHIDTARLYYNEAMIGQEIKEWIAADPANRRVDLLGLSRFGREVLVALILFLLCKQHNVQLSCTLINCWKKIGKGRWCYLSLLSNLKLT